MSERAIPAIIFEIQSTFTVASIVLSLRKFKLIFSVLRLCILEPKRNKQMKMDYVDVFPSYRDI